VLAPLPRRRGLPAVARALALLVALTGLTLWPGQARAEQAPPTVTWPTMKAFNPDVVAYTFDVQNAGENLYAGWGDYRQAITDDGPQTFSFPDAPVYYRHISLLRCDIAGCTSLDIDSPLLNVRRTLDLYAAESQLVGSVAVPPAVKVYLDPADAGPVTVEWAVMDATAVALAGTSSLSSHDSPAYGRTIDVKVPLTTTVPDGEFTLRMNVSATFPSTPAFGTLSGQITMPLTVKNHAIAPRPRVPSVFYPIRDDYQDLAYISAVLRDNGKLRIDVLNPANVVVKKLSDWAWWIGFEEAVTWDGTDSRGRIVPAGRYTIRFTQHDAYGASDTVTRPITVSHKKMVKRVWNRYFTAKEAQVSKYVGRCSSLITPVKKAWKGSQGYRSLNKCSKTKKNAGQVLTTNGVYIPDPIEGRYGTATVTLHGSPAKGSTGRSKGHPYIALSYLSSHDEYRWKRIIRSNGRHAGAAVGVKSLLFRDKNGPYILWGTGLTDGSRFDVRGYTVRVEYYALT
jgi:hypothetical protein